ncbi:MAG: PLDc N-terminal domain-containing protein [Acidimicrobiia bacterium]
MFETWVLDPILWVAIFIPLILLFVASFVDLYRRKDLSVLRKLAWVAVIVLTLYIGVALYYLLRPPRTPVGKRSGETKEGTKSIVDQLEGLRRSHDRGELDDAAFLEAKRGVLGLADQSAGAQ